MAMSPEQRKAYKAEYDRKMRAWCNDRIQSAIDEMEELYSFEVEESFVEQAVSLHLNPDDDGADGKRVDEVIRATIVGIMEYCHGANQSDVSIKSKKKAAEIKTGMGELSEHFRTQADAKAALQAFMNKERNLLKTRGYFIYQMHGNPYNLGSAVVYNVPAFESMIRRGEVDVVVKYHGEKDDPDYWTIAIQSATTCKSGCERYIQWATNGKVFSDWLYEITGQY